jgi:hypothetical protein
MKIDLREIGLGGMDWIDLSRDRNQWRTLLNTEGNFRDAEHFGKFLST